MVEFVLFMLFSILETCALLFLAFKTFKIDIFPIEMVFASIVSGFFSYVLRHEYGLIDLDVLIQFVLMFCFIWLLFRIHIFYAVIMTSMAYQAYLLIQTFYYLFFEQFNLLVHLPEFSSNVTAYTLQTLSAFTGFFLGILIGRSRKGFDFIPDKPTGRITVQFREKILFALSIPSILIILCTMQLTAQLSHYYFVLPAVYAIILYTYLYLSYKKDRNGYEHNGS
ncbi:hypothetical protein J2Z22_003062 [Paenibacillus forsythiae]|uniref:Uncharacterized protein n=1 Tax=Paenibacillus forsythiae TaxID=365616 RepID=A0ABU3H9K9_9BACL|nr:hypothetical protein [Paenibacillus forsythiae]MDT3427499.1 hypothetical protein [Paenibacillus forsythiae]